MGVFHVFKIVQMVQNRAMHHIYAHFLIDLHDIGIFKHVFS